MHVPRILYALAGVLAMLWLAGLLTGQSLGGYIHLLLVFSILSVLASLVYDEVHSSSERAAVR
ncbi:MAG: lmo0937 family membrane protein [Minisyncoccota bacterium]